MIRIVVFIDWLIYHYLVVTHLEILRRALFSARHTTSSAACSLELNYTDPRFWGYTGPRKSPNLIPKSNDASVIHFQTYLFCAATARSRQNCVSGFRSTVYWKTMWSRQNSVGNLSNFMGILGCNITECHVRNWIYSPCCTSDTYTPEIRYTSADFHVLRQSYYRSCCP
jgi:hypothetical protein